VPVTKTFSEETMVAPRGRSSLVNSISYREAGDASIKAILLFGSKARGEDEERSDADILVLHDGCGIEDPVARRRHFYGVVRAMLRGSVEEVTVTDMELMQFLKPERVTALLLNIYWDASVVMDRTGTLPEFLKIIRENIAKSGLERIRDGKAYRWILPEPMKEVKLL